MYNILKAVNKGVDLGVWIFDENDLGVFIPKKCIKRIIEFVDELSLVGPGYHETYGHIRCYVEPNGDIRIEDVPDSNTSEHVIIPEEKLKLFAYELLVYT